MARDYSKYSKEELAEMAGMWQDSFNQEAFLRKMSVRFSNADAQREILERSRKVLGKYETRQRITMAAIILATACIVIGAVFRIGLQIDWIPNMFGFVLLPVNHFVDSLSVIVALFIVIFAFCEKTLSALWLATP